MKIYDQKLELKHKLGITIDTIHKIIYCLTFLLVLHIRFILLKGV